MEAVVFWHPNVVVGKCLTPRSIAQKKAFFKAHYKKIATIKAEVKAGLLNQEVLPVGGSEKDDQS
ncbi:hypothetical protein Lser_V15G25362 [Lactuca serriola]